MSSQLQAVLEVGASFQSEQKSSLCSRLCRSCMKEGILVVFGLRERMIGVAEDAVLGVVLLEWSGDVSSDE